MYLIITLSRSGTDPLEPCISYNKKSVRVFIVDSSRYQRPSHVPMPLNEQRKTPHADMQIHTTPASGMA